MREIVVPKLNTNDESCTLNRWLVEDGATVGAETPIAVLETSKAAVDLLAEASGVLRRLAPAGATYMFGTVIGQILESEADRHAQAPAQPEAPALALTITQAAQELIDRHQLTPEQIRSLGKQVIRQSDIEALLLPKSAPPAPVSKNQAAVAKIVSQSHATIPPAFTLMKVSADAITTELRELRRRRGRLVGLPEAIVKAVAGLAETFPAFFAPAARDPNIGVTFDVGRGLFIPTIKSAGSKSLLEITAQMVEYRVKAIEGGFTDAELSGGNISVSVTTDADVVFSIPIIYPGQTAMLSLGGQRNELALSDDGAVVKESYIHLGLAYDHRFINGRDALVFLTQLRKRIESAADVKAA